MRGPKPFLKWAGGKGRLLPELEAALPPEIDGLRHVEPCIGGGALFFRRRPERALLGDVNPELVGCYEAVRDDPEGLIRRLRIHRRAHSKERFYQVRERFNRERRLGPTGRAAAFIYLNKTCFNGLHRVNRRGEFNVPFGSYDDPPICDEQGLRLASAALQGCELQAASFDETVAEVGEGDFVYFDPPYAPRSPTASFTGYAKGGFGESHQQLLREVVRELAGRGAKVMISNSDVPSVRKLYKGLRRRCVNAPRSINSNATKRGKVGELVITTY